MVRLGEIKPVRSSSIIVLERERMLDCPSALIHFNIMLKFVNFLALV